MKPIRIIVLAVAAVAAIALAVIVRGALSGKPTSTAVAAAPVVHVKPMAKVLVAKRDLKIGERLGPEDMDWQEWPIDAVNPAFVTDGSALPPPALAPGPVKADAGKAPGATKLDKLAAQTGSKPDAAKATSQTVATVTRTVANLADGGPKAAFLGAVVREPILKGEPMVERKLVRAGQSGYLAVVLPPGMRAMAVAVKVETAAGGFILPGDRVDVILSRQMQREGGAGFASSTVLRNVKVLAVDQVTQPDKNETTVVGATATLQVGAEDAEALALAKAQGDLSLVLRSYADVGEPSGRVAAARRVAQAGAAPPMTAVRVFRNGEATEVAVRQ